MLCYTFSVVVTLASLINASTPPSVRVHTTCHALADMEKYGVADQQPPPPSCKNTVTYIQAEELPSPKMSADNYAAASNAPGQHDT